MFIRVYLCFLQVRWDAIEEPPILEVSAPVQDDRDILDESAYRSVS